MVKAETVKIVRFLDIPQKELGNRMRVSKSLVSAVESGTNRIKPEFAIKFKRAVGITDAVLIDIQYLQTQIAE